MDGAALILGLAISSCAPALPLHHMTPPGGIMATDLGNETVTLQDHGIILELDFMVAVQRSCCASLMRQVVP